MMRHCPQGVVKATIDAAILCGDFTVVGKFGNGFIVIKSGSRLFLVDQHAADERRLLNRLMLEKGVNEATEELKLLACMSAVKLSTEQSKDQISNIITELLTGPFPFICAHGRPSIILLI